MGTTRALRVALIQAGRIVEDRTFTGRAKVTVGTDPRSTFLVPMADVPVTTAVFDLTKKGTTNRGRIGGVGFAEDTLRSAPVELCITAMMRGWVLPFTPEDEVPVSLPFIFAAG